MSDMTTPPGASGLDFTHGNLEDQHTLLYCIQLLTPGNMGQTCAKVEQSGKPKEKKTKLGKGVQGTAQKKRNECQPKIW